MPNVYLRIARTVEPFRPRPLDECRNEQFLAPRDNATAVFGRLSEQAGLLSASHYGLRAVDEGL
jgi:hypothetical protein